MAPLWAAGGGGGVSAAGTMDEAYDVIVLGTGLTVSVPSSSPPLPSSSLCRLRVVQPPPLHPRQHPWHARAGLHRPKESLGIPPWLQQRCFWRHSLSLALAAAQPIHCLGRGWRAKKDAALSSLPSPRWSLQTHRGLSSTDHPLLALFPGWEEMPGPNNFSCL